MTTASVTVAGLQRSALAIIIGAVARFVLNKADNMNALQWWKRIGLNRRDSETKGSAHVDGTILWDKSSAELSRRGFLEGTTAAAVLGATTMGAFEFVGSGPLAAQTKLSSDESLKELMDGNRRFTSGHMTSWEHDLVMLKQHTAEKQEPFAAVLSCADSRVPVELLFDQTIGHLFVVRIAGNMISPEVIASLEYGVAVLGVKVLLVMGHGSCGAVKAAIQGKAVPGQISALYSHLQPAVDQAGPDLEATIKANAKIQASLLRKSSPVLAGSLKESQIKIVAGYYDISSGAVTVLE
jgi:carbonic anhydrase